MPYPPTASLRQERLDEHASKVRLRKSEIASLSSELDQTVKQTAELQKSSSVQIPSEESHAEHLQVPLSPGAASFVVRRMSHENVQDAEEELAQVLQQLDCQPKWGCR